MSRTDREKVEKVRKEGGDVHYLSWVVSERDVLKLIQAERRAVVRMVKNLKKEISKGFRLYGVYPVHAGSYHEACADILKAMAARGRKR